jgi:hypothetical protein
VAAASDPNRVPNAPPPSSTNDVAEDMIVLDNKIKQLKFEYDQYFIGSRPREPVLTRGEVNKLVTRYSNTGIQNTALRFKFNTLCSRLFAMRRQWDETLRKIEAGTYERHVFKTKLHERERGISEDGTAPKAAAAKRTPTRHRRRHRPLRGLPQRARELRRGCLGSFAREARPARRETARRDPAALRLRRSALPRRRRGRQGEAQGDAGEAIRRLTSTARSSGAWRRPGVG